MTGKAQCQTRQYRHGAHGEYVGLDVKAMRTTRDADSYKHLENSPAIATVFPNCLPEAGMRTRPQGNAPRL